jgi:hypothetical protein
MRVVVWVGVFLCCCGSCGCSGSQTQSVLHVSKTFLNDLGVLRASSNVYHDDVQEAVASAKKELAEAKDVKIDLPKVAAEWEKKWKKVDEQTAVLEKNFKAVEHASKAYWNKLDEVTTAITDPKLREREKKKNDEAKSKWADAYENAKTQIEKAKKLRDKGRDFQNVMLAVTLRGQLAEYTETLNEIAGEAANLLQELERVTEQGKSIVNP